MKVALSRSEVKQAARSGAEQRSQDAGAARVAPLVESEKSAAGYQSLLNRSPSVAALQQKSDAVNRGSALQMKAEDEEQSKLQMKAEDEEQAKLQMKAEDEEQSKLQMKTEDEEQSKLQMKTEDEEQSKLQMKSQDDDLAVQQKASPVQREEKPNATGLTDSLKAGVEQLSGTSLDDVKVHYGSSEPAAVQAHAFTRGSEIHVAPGQEQHVPHEAWHVAQQKQGRVPVTGQVNGVALNDDPGLEREADVMGAKAASAGATLSG